MTFNEPVGLLAFGFLPLFLVLLLRSLKRRRVEVSSYFLLKEVFEALPVLPRSFLWRKRLQVLLFILAVVLAAFAAGGPVIGSRGDRPAKMLLVLDHLSGWKEESGGRSGWDDLTEKARGVLKSLRRDDRIMLVRSDTGPVPGGFLTIREAATSLKRQSPSDLPLRHSPVRDRLRLLQESFSPDHLVVITPFPARWERILDETKGSWQIVPSHPPPGSPNLGILDAEVRPDLLQPEHVRLFVRVGAFAPPELQGPLEAALRVELDGELMFEDRLSLTPGTSEGIVVPRLQLRPGLLAVRLLPEDHFSADNLFSTPVRPRPFLEARLSTPGNRSLEAALRSLKGLSLTVAAPEAPPPASPFEVLVYDKLVPDVEAANLLLIRPTSSSPGLSLRGEVRRPSVIEADRTHPVLEGVGIDGLEIKEMPILQPAPSLRVIARADGYPLIMLGKNPAGGRTAVVSFDPVASGWDLEPSFPILIANLVSWLAEEEAGSTPAFLVGDYLPEHILRQSSSITDPDGGLVRAEKGVSAPFRLKRAGRYALSGEPGEASGELFVNLLSEEVSRSMVRPDSGGDIERAALFQPGPFRYELLGALLAAGIALLLLEMVVAPRVQVGRLEE